MKINSKHFRVRAGEEVKLKQWPTRVKSFYKSKEHYKDILARHVEELSERQSLLYAYNRYSVLLIFQGMDAAGKDGVIKHLMSGVNPEGCEVFSFKQPSAEELKHDFLWRTTCRLPERGRIGIFNRSYYEEVLVVRVHPELLEQQRLPEGKEGKELWQERYESINDIERHLVRNGTVILKFFLNESPGEQKERFLARLDDPAKQWKFNPADIKERNLWDEYMKAYEKMLSGTSTKEAPWYIIPADQKWLARTLVSSITTRTIESLHLQYPKPSKEMMVQLEEAKKKLKAD